jgi:hypothetical protein
MKEEIVVHCVQIARGQTYQNSKNNEGNVSPHPLLILIRYENRCMNGLGGNAGVFGALDIVGVPDVDEPLVDVSMSLRKGTAIWGTGGEECSLMNTYETGCWNVSANLLVSAIIRLAIVTPCRVFFNRTSAFCNVGNERTSGHLLGGLVVLKGPLQCQSLFGAATSLATQGPRVSVRF